MIVVTAAAGQTGAAVVAALRSRGLPVRAVVGHRGPRPELTALGAEVVTAELTQPVAWPGVLTGADALYLIWPNFDPDEAEGAAALFAEARRAGPEPLTAPRVAELLGAALGREVVADDVVPAGEVPISYRARCRRLMLDHYRAHGFAGSPRVATALLGRPPRTYAEHLEDLLGPA